jgi:UDP-glucose 4-epimerase
VILRYFNPIGSLYPQLGEAWGMSDKSVIFKLCEAAHRKKHFMICGNDYDTEDGTPVRDFIDVRDLAHAHVRTALLKHSGTYNLGAGKGVTIRQLVDLFSLHVCPVNAQVGLPRQGDIAYSVADTAHARKTLEFHCQHDLLSSLQSAWKSYLQSIAETI